MGLDSVGTEIYAILGYFRGLTIGQRTPGFLGCHSYSLKKKKEIIDVMHDFDCSRHLENFLYQDQPYFYGRKGMLYNPYLAYKAQPAA